MRRIGWMFVGFLLLGIATAWGQTVQYNYPPTPVKPVTDDYHGTKIVDDYRWLEDSSDPEVGKWVAAQEEFTHSFIDTLPQVTYLMNRFEKLWRYDRDGVPHRVVDGDRVFFMRKLADKEKSIYMTRENKDASAEVVLDPNTWGAKATLDSPLPSRDGRYVAYGVSHGGDENPAVRVLDLASGQTLPDSLRGWQQQAISWLPDNSGFYYIAQPLPGDVPEGEEYYWGKVYLHELGTPASKDVVVFEDNKVKERWHSVEVSDDGKWELLWRGTYYSNQLFIRKVGSSRIKPVTTDFDAQYDGLLLGDKLLIVTDKDAPNSMVYITSAKKPQRKHWKVFLPEGGDNLTGVYGIGGRVYATYMHNATTRIAVYDLKGNHLRDVNLPTLGTARVSGNWNQPEVWISFTSFSYPSTVYLYSYDSDSLKEYSRVPIDVDADKYNVDQVWYPSKDGTKVSMFVVYRKGLKRDGSNPVFLTGYGGFNISETPYFSTTNIVWLELGGIYALPNLRGGGEYGQAWHEAGMLDKKQNVFDDFIAAAEYLMAEGYTTRKRLAIAGGSNGGLLTGAAVVQRPDLFAGVEVAVPLLDMLRYHTNKYANVWSEEYGNSDNPEQFKYLRAYSPYHNIPEGAVFPPTLIWASENDARVDPYHARKMVAKMQAVGKGGPILYLERKASGHGGGTTLTSKMRQTAETRAFLMHCVGMTVPVTAPQDEEAKDNSTPGAAAH